MRLSEQTLTELITHNDNSIKAYAAQLLAHFGTCAVGAVPGLICAIQEKGPARYWAINALGAIGVDAQTAIPLLLEALRDEDATIRRASAKALGKITRKERAVMTALERALKDENLEVRFFVAEALERIEPGIESIGPVLREVEEASTANAEIRRRATRLLDRRRES